MVKKQKNPLYIGVTLKRLREEKDMTQEDLCFESKLNRSHLGRLEKNRSEPLFQTIIKLAKGFNMTRCDFLTEINKDIDLDEFFDKM